MTDKEKAYKDKIVKLMVRCAFISPNIGEKKPNKLTKLFYRAYNKALCFFSKSHKAEVFKFLQIVYASNTRKKTQYNAKKKNKIHPFNTYIK